MGRMIRCGALALALFSLAAEASAADCWLMDRQGLEQARRQGACRDVFARDTWDSAEREVAEGPPRRLTPSPQEVPAPSAPLPPAALARPQDPVSGFVEGLGDDFRAFVNDLDRDFRSIGRFLSSGGVPPHTTPGR